MFVFADSVLCVGQMKDTPEAIERWRGLVAGLRLYSSYQDAVGIDGDATEFEWENFPEFSSLAILQDIRKDLERKSRGVQRTHHLHVNVQWRLIGTKERILSIVSRMQESQELRDEILARTQEILGSRVGREVVWKFFGE